MKSLSSMKTLSSIINESLQQCTYDECPEIYDIFIEEGICTNDNGILHFSEVVDEGKLRRAFSKAKNVAKKVGGAAKNAVKNVHGRLSSAASYGKNYNYMDVLG